MHSTRNKSVFVFGSNEAGRHGKGAARTALLKYGAQPGMSYGHVGNSFAIPTKDCNLQTLGERRIDGYVAGFLAYAEGHPELTFKVTRIGCGLAGLPDEMMAPKFANAPNNCLFDTEWEEWLPFHRFWGTF